MPSNVPRPHLTEKTIALAKKGQYTFLVDPSLTKAEAIHFVRKIYDVHPQRAMRLGNPAKIKRVSRSRRVRSALKKIIVTLRKGEKIADFVIESSVNKDRSGSDNEKKK